MDNITMTISVTETDASHDNEELIEAIEAEIDDALTRIENRYGIKVERRTDT